MYENALFKLSKLEKKERRKRMKYKTFLLRNIENRLHAKWKKLSAERMITMRELLLNALKKEIQEEETE